MYIDTTNTSCYHDAYGYIKLLISKNDNQTLLAEKKIIERILYDLSLELGYAIRNGNNIRALKISKHYDEEKQKLVLINKYINWKDYNSIIEHVKKWYSSVLN